VVDVQRKPLGLTSLLDIIYLRCIRFDTNQERNSVGDTIENWSKTWECAAKWCTGLSGAPGPRPNKQTTLGNSLSALRYNSPDCPVCTGHVRWASGATANWRQRSTAKGNNDEQCRAEVRGHQTCSVWHRLSGAAKGQTVPTVNSSKPQRVCWRDAHRIVNNDCPVRPSTTKLANG
jgi:hypothetical protein